MMKLSFELHFLTQWPKNEESFAPTVGAEVCEAALKWIQITIMIGTFLLIHEKRLYFIKDTCIMDTSIKFSNHRREQLSLGFQANSLGESLISWKRFSMQSILMGKENTQASISDSNSLTPKGWLVFCECLNVILWNSSRENETKRKSQRQLFETASLKLSATHCNVCQLLYAEGWSIFTVPFSAAQSSRYTVPTG